MLRGFRYKLKPTDAQAALFRQFAGVCRAIYNAALFQRQHWGKRYRLGYLMQARELTQLRAEFDWIAAVSQTCQQQALRDLDKAFANFFAGRAKYPTPRRKRVDEAFRFQGREVETRRLNRNWSEVRLPKIGWVRFRDTRPFKGTVKNATVSLDGLGWHISFAVECANPTPTGLAAKVGIDRGVANTLALSTGELASVPIERLRVLARRYAGAQRDAARRKRGSKRHAKAKARAAAISAKAARIRKDWNHKATRSLANRFGAVVLEDLKIANMTRSARGTVEEPGRKVAQKAGLNRAILQNGWFQFETFLTYKLAETGGTLVLVDPRNTSRKCSECGNIDARSRESQAQFRCVECGHQAHADINAARNILQAGTRPSLMVKHRRKSRVAA